MNNNKILFIVNFGNIRVVTWASGREEAKRNAHVWLGADPDKYIVTPLSEIGDRVRIDITLAI